MARISRKNIIFRRLEACRRILKLDTQRIRVEIVNKLRDIFNAAHSLAKNRDLELKEREKWARVAAFAAQTIDGLCSKFDEREMDGGLSELQGLIDEANAKKQTERAEEKDGYGEKDSKSPDQQM